jgi:cell division protein FtsB
MKKLLYHPLIIIIITIISGLFLLSLKKTAQKSETAAKNVAVLEGQINQLAGQIETEKQAIEYTSSDLAKEKILRDELLLQKPGEYVLQIPEENRLNSEDSSIKQKSNWEAWRELLF